MTALLGALIEAWSEFRVHRARVLLSLVGVAIAVCSLTGVVGLGQIASQAQVEQMERGAGRPATLLVTPPIDLNTGKQPDTAKFLSAVQAIVQRYSIEFAGTVAWSQLDAQFMDGVRALSATAVDVDYGVMHRVQLGEGRWFEASDMQRLAPVVIVSDPVWQLLGAPALATHPTLLLHGAQPINVEIIGVLPPSLYDQQLSLFGLNSAFRGLTVQHPAMPAQPPQVELWVPQSLAFELSDRIKSDLINALGDEYDASGAVFRQDYLAWGNFDPMGPLTLVLSGIAGLILLLGALGLVNISLVTMRQRIREIGIRRAFGASAPRVFLAVMLESVVATVAAGAVGVMVAVFVVQQPLLRELIAPGLSDAPPFPAGAAILGLATACGVGALAGLLPAVVAVRVKVIDAIRS